MEANHSPRPTAPNPAARRKRPHPAQHARRTAAAVSVGSFLALTGAFAVKTAVTGTATTGASTSSTQTTTVTSTDDGAVVIGGQQSSDDDSERWTDDDWSASAGNAGSTWNSPGTASSGPATTQSHGS